MIERIYVAAPYSSKCYELHNVPREVQQNVDRAIAAHYFGCDFVGCEIDVDYFNAAKERFDRETRQVAMF